MRNEIRKRETKDTKAKNENKKIDVREISQRK